MKKSREEIETKINMLAWKDPSFKQKMLKNPEAALKEAGFNVPAHAKIHVHEETGDTLHLVIHKVPINAKNMSEEELKKIAAAQAQWLCGG
ncbi:MAG: hypothetical protein COT85_04510 [Chlamydiae bacterium CG10_big_fil_rev_8_21_14_0_10_42_34]|nr:MAG: hypothetical protein COT85_04510 [Chlamydiae bacterium CG10_big_fil_rev_8_21_14_0_10_42_34]